MAEQRGRGRARAGAGPAGAARRAAAAGLRGLAAAGLLACGLPAPAAGPSPTAAAGPAVVLQSLALDLRLDWAARQLVGVATLQLQGAAPVRQVPLQAAGLRVDSVHDGQGQALAHAVVGQGADGRLQVDLGRSLAPGDLLTLRIAYRSTHVQQADPLALGGHSGAGLRWFEPSAADPRRQRQVWASGEFGTQAHWLPLTAEALRGQARFASRLTLTVDRPLVAVASGVPAGVRSHADGTRSFHFHSGAAHTAQALGFVVGAYVPIPQRAAGVQLTSWSLPDEAAATAASVERLPETLVFLEGLTGRPAPVRHFSQVFVQDHPWGHALQGLAVQSENMVDDFGVHADFQYLWDLLQAETLAAQWFDAAAGACDPRHAWLWRGASRYAAALSMAQAHGPQEMSLYALAADQAAALADPQPLVPEKLNDPRAFLAGTVPTARGAAVLHLLRWEIGEDAFMRALQGHLRRSGDEADCTQAWRRALESETGRDLGWFFDQWVHGGGHPDFTLHTRWDAGTGTLAVRVQQAVAEGGRAFQGHIGLEIDGQVRRLWLAPQADNSFSLRLPAAPRWVQLDPQGAWIRQLQHAAPLPALLAQLRETPEAMSRLWAGQQLAVRWRDAPAEDRTAILAALREVAGAPGRWWRERFIVLNLLRTLLAPAPPTSASVLDDDLRRTLHGIAGQADENAWLRATALRLLGDSRDPRDADLFLAQLGGASDRVINAAAIGLGRSGDARAFGALAALPRHPSWKNQSLISALAGLAALGDARGGDIALAALADLGRPRWVLNTAVWDYPLAAAETLAALGQGARGVPLLQPHLAAALAAGRDLHDVCYTLTLLAALRTPDVRPLIDEVQQRLGTEPGMAGLLAALRERLAGG